MLAWWKNILCRIIASKGLIHQLFLKKKFLLKTHLRSFHEGSDIHPRFLIWDLFLSKNRITGTKVRTDQQFKNTSLIWRRLFLRTFLKNTFKNKLRKILENEAQWFYIEQWALEEPFACLKGFSVWWNGSSDWWRVCCILYFGAI